MPRTAVLDKEGTEGRQEVRDWAERRHPTRNRSRACHARSLVLTPDHNWAHLTRGCSASLLAPSDRQ